MKHYHLTHKDETYYIPVDKVLYFGSIDREDINSVYYVVLVDGTKLEVDDNLDGYLEFVEPVSQS